MNKKLYGMMDWARIEGLVYSEENQPHDFLGAHRTDDGVLIQSFIPTAAKVEVVLSGTSSTVLMDQEDEAGFFAALLPRKTVPSYTLRVTYDDGTVQDLYDPYSFKPQLTRQMTEAFNKGICYDLYDYLGAHPMTVDGVSGVYFAVWAPNAVRVSVVGDFNLWDGRRLPMRRLWNSGIFELFVPGLSEGEIYKYEIKAKGGLTFLKADPYANAAELRPDTASVITDLSAFEWTDESWLEKRRSADPAKDPCFIYEVHLGTWKKPEDGRDFYNYRELAHMLADYVKEMGYTHIELMPIMEYPLDESWGYQTTGYFAPTARYGTPQDFQYFMNYMHEQGIGVILDWVPSAFPRDTFGLCGFDGTCLYEHKDPRQGTHPQWGTLLYNYGRPEVKNFLIASALFWKNIYHADAIRFDSVAAMMYLDYGKNDGEWIANMYGGNENLEAAELIKHLNSIFKKQGDGAALIAQETTGWPKVTGALNDNGLGFDLKWNNGWTADLLSYMQLDPVFRGYHHGDLTFSMVYNYSENFLLALSHDEVSHGKGSLLAKMPGRRESKYANLRAVYGYLLAHPGKKLLFMGQDLAPLKEWTSDRAIDWNLAENEVNQRMQTYVQALLKLYRSQPALYALDFDPDGFEWINNISANENMLVFLRKSEKTEETLLIVCNFSPLVYKDHKIGVPFSGRYKEIFNSDRTEFGGSGNVNPRVKNSKKDECDARADSIRITVPPMGISVFSCTPQSTASSGNEKAKSARTSGKSAASAKRRAVSQNEKLQKAKTGRGTNTAAAAKNKKAAGETLKERLEKKVREEGN